VYELAALLHARAGDRAFWSDWERLHALGLRRLEALSFRLAREWFGGAASPEVEAEPTLLPRRARAWFDAFALSPAVMTFRPNKDHLWLHLTLLESRRDAWQVARQRLLPGHLPVAAGDAFVTEEDLTWRDWLGWRLHWATHVAKRAWHHAQALPATAASAVRWWLRLRRIPE
jgi:hypothetical protein